MKLKIFYSWQSDLPSKNNRGLIENSLKRALETVYEKNPIISEYEITSDCRNESGTPDLVVSIFKNIDECDIFLADISIVTKSLSQCESLRKTPNPNVLIELGYAAKSKGWNQIICVFNKEYGAIEEAPFDIRFRKPLIYDTSGERSKEKSKLTSLLVRCIDDILNSTLIEQRYYIKVKRSIDLGMQAILIDFCRLFFDDNETQRYNYPQILNSTLEELHSLIDKKVFLGFKVYKNISINISSFDEFFSKEINTYFLTQNEKKIIVKLIYALREYQEFLNSNCLVKKEIEKNGKLFLVNCKSMSKSNPPNSFLLMERIDKEKGIVLDSGQFDDKSIPCLLESFSFEGRTKQVFCGMVLTINKTIQEWIQETGNYFIYNPRLFQDSKTLSD